MSETKNTTQGDGEKTKRASSGDNEDVQTKKQKVLENQDPDVGDLNDPAVLDENMPLFEGKIENASNKLVVGLVGLPARGKSFLARKLAYYLNWMEIQTTIFNHGEYRRCLLGSRQPASFYDPDNTDGVKTRLSVARLALKDLLKYLNDGGQVGIMDATNSSLRRRQMIEKECARHGVSVFWVESICDRESVIDDNIMKVKMKLPEYSHMTPEDILEDFKKRIEFYKKAYTSLDSTSTESNASFMKIYNLGNDFLIHKPQGTLVMRIVRFLMSVHNRPRSIYLSRHGESTYNKHGKIGGDAGLTESGYKYSVALKKYIEKQGLEDIKVWTSSLQRTIQTAALFDNARVRTFKVLDELNAGELDGCTYEEIKVNRPELYELRSKNKYYYRYPCGESYKDVVSRLEPLLLELEREGDLLVIAHQAVCRCLLAYFKCIPQDQLSKELPYLEVPLHTVLKVTPGIFGCKIEEIMLGPDAVNTHHGRPDSATPPK
eukprot:m.165802 g.165802  ORF g.165802 m.165802 type:complete len:490 (-) comp31398_c0_seq1:49-1518(-)